MKVSLTKRYPYMSAAVYILMAMPFIPLFVIYFPSVLDFRFGPLLLCGGGLVAALPFAAVVLFLWNAYESRRL